MIPKVFNISFTHVCHQGSDAFLLTVCPEVGGHRKSPIGSESNSEKWLNNLGSEKSPRLHNDIIGHLTLKLRGKKRSYPVLDGFYRKF